MNFDRRKTLGMLIAGVAATPFLAGCEARGGRAKSDSRPRGEINLSAEEWRQRLTPEQYRVLREASTERPFSSPLNDEHRKGIFACAGCDLALYSSATKYDSGTGWPSFWDHLPDAIRTMTDYELGLPRTEVHCRRCAGHLGHVFEDGPPPTGLRYCMNGVAMTFNEGEAAV